MEREAEYEQALPPDSILSEDYTDYEGDLVAAVSSLNDLRSASSLAAVINTGSMATSSLAAFGATELDPVIEKLNSSDDTLRLSAAIVLAKMEITDPVSRDKLYQALIRAAEDRDPYVRATGLEGLNRLQPGAPVLVSEVSSNRAIVLDSVTWTRDPFPIFTPWNFSPDHRSRLLHFAVNCDLLSGETASAVTAQIEDTQHKVFPLSIEYVGRVPDITWLTQIVVRLPDQMSDTGEALVSTLRGVASNKVAIKIKPAESSSTAH